MARVVLIGANGHGRHHRRHVAELAERGLVELVGLADPAPVPDAPAGVPLFTDHRELLAAVAADVAIVCTPPHTHLPIGLDVLAAGADLLLEKPPVLDLAQHAALADAAAATGGVIQVGFQALASPALHRLRAAIADGRLGVVRGVSVVAAWQRDDAYWARSPWAGRRTVAGRPTLDGALANAHGHAVMQALAVLDAPVERVEVAWCRVRPMEVEDTATLRLTLAGGAQLLIAVTLAGEEFIDGDLAVVDSTGRAELAFRLDRQGMPGDPEPVLVDGRRSLLENLVAHRRTGEPLLAPLTATARFTAVIEALRAMPAPTEVDPGYVMIHDNVRILRNVNAVLRRCAEEFALLTDVDMPWAANAGGGTANLTG